MHKYTYRPSYTHIPTVEQGTRHKQIKPKLTGHNEAQNDTTAQATWQQENNIINIQKIIKSLHIIFKCSQMAATKK